MEKQQKKKVKELEKLDKVKIGYARVSSQSTGKQVQQLDIYYQFVGKLDEI